MNRRPYPDDTEQPGVVELLDSINDLFGVPNAAKLVIAKRPLARRVLRVQFNIRGEVRSIIAKRMAPETARRNALVVQRWLPAVGLTRCAPSLLRTVADRQGEWVWQVYEDVGDAALAARISDRVATDTAVEVIARVHTSFARHRLLGECRLRGGDLGMAFYVSNVRDALYALEGLRSARGRISREQAALCDRLRQRLSQLLDEEPNRAKTFATCDPPETLLHGDLWTTNILLESSECAPLVRLIDWDHAGAGPITYDLSTLLYRFPRTDRDWVLRRYREHMLAAGWQWPSLPELNVLLDTAEQARLANRVIWPAIAAVEESGEWAFEELAAVEGWFEALAPPLLL